MEQDENEATEAPDLVKLHHKWKAIIEKREKQYDEYWQRARAVSLRFEDQRNTNAEAFRYKGGRQAGKKYNILWANTETMMPLLFNKVPDPVVRRRWGDDRPVARAAAELLERASTFNVQRDDVHFVDHMKASVQNKLVPGTGVLWVRYDPNLRPVGVDEMGEPVMGVGDQTVHFDYVHYDDYMAGKANVESQVPWKCRKLWLFPQEVTARFGAAVAVMCHPKRRPDGGESTADGPEKCCIYEIWDKASGMVLFFAKEMPRIIEANPDPLGLQNFYPCVKPLFGFWSTRDVIPEPLFTQYQDQAMELDTITAQIYNLIRACKVSGVYNGMMGSDFQRMLEGNENKVIPVEDWPEFANTGGVTGNVALMPINEVVQALGALFEARERVKQDLNELTGMPDIIRGQSSPLDGEGTNDLKVQWGSSRMRDAQRDVQRFAAGNIALATEIMAEHFTPQNLMGMSGMNLPTAQEKQAMEMAAQQAAMTGQEIPMELQDRLEEPTIEEVMQLIRSERLRGFQLDVETDSTVEADDAKEQESRGEFINVLTGMVKEWGPIVAQIPVMLPMVKELIMFAVAPYRAGRQLEEELERTFATLERQTKAQMQAPPQPDAMDKAAQIEMNKTAMQEEGDTQREAMKQRGENWRTLAKIQADRESDSADRVVKLVEKAVP